MTLADRAQGKDSKSEKTRMVMGAEEEPRTAVGLSAATLMAATASVAAMI
jgi:hypothetical protein